MKMHLYLSLVIAVILTAACSGDARTIDGTDPGLTAAPAGGSTAETDEADSPSTPYPAPIIETRDTSAYPAPVETADPNAPKVPVVPFHLDRPIAVGATTITGSGPAGVPILIVDVTLYGEILAKTVIQSDGTFSVTVPAPLEANHRIGLSLDDLTGTGWTEDTFADPGFFGEEFKLVPMVGVYYDTVLIN